MNYYKIGSEKWRMIYGKFGANNEFINPKEYLIQFSE